MTLSPHLPPFNGLRILVGGDVMLDRYLFGTVTRISPEAPVPVVSLDREEERPGGAANVAMNVAALGAEVTLVGLVGADECAPRLQALMQQGGVNAQLSVASDKATVSKLRVIAQRQQLLRVDRDPAYSSEDCLALLDKFRRGLEHCDMVLLSDYGKGTLQHASEFIHLAGEAGKYVVVDPKGTDYARYRGAKVLTPNRSEFEAVAGPCPTLESLVDRALELRLELGLDALVITRGGEGASVVFGAGEVAHLPASKREVYDLTGAGDTFASTLSCALAAGCHILQAAMWANAAAGESVTRLGAVAISPESLSRALHEIPPPEILKREAELSAELEARSRGGERIVMTNGCFDILHGGHVDFLRRARELGDSLVVALNDDESVRRLKGGPRPVNPLNARAQLLAALPWVDRLVSFSGDTPEHLICRLRPHVLVKGTDYSLDSIAGADCVRSAGGEVHTLALLSGCGSTRVLERLTGAVG